MTKMPKVVFEKVFWRISLEQISKVHEESMLGLYALFKIPKAQKIHG